jgi:DNA-binding GntR family transcriptional regulator
VYSPFSKESFYSQYTVKGRPSLSEIQIERRMLRDQVKSYLTDAILRGVYKPGERLIETRIAQQLGVSQAPVREAMRELELLGFLKSEPFRGASVRQLSTEELTEIYTVRAALEGAAAHSAATKLTEDDFARLAELLDKMLTTAAHADQRGFAEHNVEFHRVIVEASGNRTLLNVWNILQPSTWTLFSTMHSGHDLIELAARHRVVIEALRKRDPQRAEQAMHSHLEEIGEWVQSQEEQDQRAAQLERSSLNSITETLTS